MTEVVDRFVERFLQHAGNRERFTPKDKPSGFIPRPLQGQGVPLTREYPTYAEGCDQVKEQDGRIVQTVRSKGRVLLNCVGGTTDPVEQQRCYTIVTKEKTVEELDEAIANMTFDEKVDALVEGGLVKDEAEGRAMLIDMGEQA